MSITEKETGNPSKERDREGGKEEKEKRKQCATSVKGHSRIYYMDVYSLF